MSACPTCGQPADQPWREHDPAGAIRYGCIDPVHTGHLTGADLAWHNRREAHMHRASCAAHDSALALQALGRSAGTTGRHLDRMARAMRVRPTGSRR